MIAKVLLIETAVAFSVCTRLKEYNQIKLWGPWIPHRSMLLNPHWCCFLMTSIEHSSTKGKILKSILAITRNTYDVGLFKMHYKNNSSKRPLTQHNNCGKSINRADSCNLCSADFIQTQFWNLKRGPEIFTKYPSISFSICRLTHSSLPQPWQSFPRRHDKSFLSVYRAMYWSM